MLLNPNRGFFSVFFPFKLFSDDFFCDSKFNFEKELPEKTIGRTRGGNAEKFPIRFLTKLVEEFFKKLMEKFPKEVQ